MKEKMYAALLLLLLVFAMSGGVVHAQRATPTPQPPTATPDSYPAPPDPDPDPTVPAGAPSVPGTQTSVQIASKGSVRGTIFEDVDGDGQCHTENTPILSDVSVTFRLNGGPEGLPLYSGDDGTFGLVAADLGEWQVSAKAPSGYVVTSENPVTVSISESDRVATNADFCLSAASSVQILLPESGAAAVPSSMIAVWFLIGALFLTLGIVIYRRLSQTI